MPFNESLKGGFYFHPSDEDLSLGTLVMKKPLEGSASGYSYSDFAVVVYTNTFSSIQLPVPKVTDGTFRGRSGVPF